MAWTRERWTRIEALFHEISQLPATQRAAVLDTACDGDADLRHELLALLAADDAAPDELLDRGVAAVLPRIDPLIGQRFGAFRLVERIAHGGMGTVFRATRADGDFEQEVAIKVLRLGLSTPAMRTRFARERQTLARLVHPHVARLLDGGTTAQGLPFFAMELVDGVPIDRYCDEQRLPLRRRVALFAEVCRAVQFAHQNLVVHLDLKPSNILVDRRGAPRLVDFGVAGLLDGIAEDAGEAAPRRPLTPEYASPELLRGEPISTAADVYSLGVVLFELLTGTRAFRSTGTTDAAASTSPRNQLPRPSAAFDERPGANEHGGDGPVRAIAHRAEGRAAAPAALRRALRGDLDRIVAKATEVDADRRYASCLAFAEDLERHLADLPVLAREQRVAYRIAKFTRRHLVGVSATAAVLVSLLAGIAATVHMANVAAGERDQADVARQQAERDRDAAAAAKASAERDATHARIEATSSHLIETFLGDTFLSSQAIVTDAERTRVLTMLEQRAAQFRRQHGDAAHLLANLLHALGRAAAAIDAFAIAETLLREAAELRRATFGAESLEYSISLAGLGALHYRQGRIADAVTALREAYRLQVTCEPGVHTDIALVANDLAAAERANGDPERARTLHLEALALRRASGDPALIAESLNNLANCENDPAAAHAHLREALQLRREVLGERHPLTVQSLSNLGTWFQRAGRPEEAREHLRAAVTAWRELAALGREGLAVTSATLAYVELQRDDVAAAVAAIDEALAIDRERLGPDHLRIAQVLDVRTVILDRRQQWRAAADTALEAQRIRELHLPADDRQVATGKARLGVALARAGEVERGVAMARDGLASLRRTLPVRAIDLAEALLNVGLVEELAGRLPAAEAALREALQITRSEAGAASRLRHATVHLREFLRRHDRPEEAAQIVDPQRDH